MPKPEIVILDAHAANPGDLSWEKIAELGNLTVHQHCPLSEEEVLCRCEGKEIVITNKVRFTARIMDALPQLKLIALEATGYNNIDIDAARERGIAVCNVPGYSTDSVAQLAFAFLLELASGVSRQDAAVKKGEWSKAPDFTFYACPLMELAGKTLGIFGFGTIGQKVARIGAAFGMRVIYFSRTPRGTDLGTPVPLEQLFSESDVLSLHAPMTPQTANVVNQKHLALMKPTAFLINTARGGLVESDALADALNSGRLAGAGLDVVDAEPPPANHVLLHAKNCLVTPHTAWGTHEARKRLIDELSEIVRSYLAGNPIHQVNR